MKSVSYPRGCSRGALIVSISIEYLYQLSLFIFDHYICRHNDLPYNLYQKLSNNLSAFHFERDLRNDVTWGSTACSSCFTDLPRLIEGKVGGQVSHPARPRERSITEKIISQGDNSALHIYSTISGVYSHFTFSVRFFLQEVPFIIAAPCFLSFAHRRFVCRSIFLVPLERRRMIISPYLSVRGKILLHEAFPCGSCRSHPLASVIYK